MATVKHLEFQLLREKTLTKELEEKSKTLAKQVAELEQEKADLRRANVVLTEEIKKTAKLDERIHALQKEIVNRDAVIAAERAAVTEARNEADEVRRNANASIALWTTAEEQWTAEQASMNEALGSCQSQLEILQNELSTQKVANTELVKNLQVEKERSTKLLRGSQVMEEEVKALHSQVERLQNKSSDLEQTIYKLDLAGDKLRDALNLKDTEIKTLEATLARYAESEERLEQTINSLNDRMNAAKMQNLEGKGENEKLQCDVADAKKEIDRLNLQIDSLKRDSSFISQSHSSVQKALEDLREKHRQQQDDLKDKNVEIRRHELTISQLNMELKKRENQGGEWSFQYSSLEAELLQTKESLKKVTASADRLVDENTKLQAKIADLANTIENKDEEMVLLQSRFEERAEVFSREISNLEKEIEARQSMINELSEQLNATSEKNAGYHTKILEECETTVKVRQELSRLQLDVQAKSRDMFISRAVADKYEQCVHWFSNEWSDLRDCEAYQLRGFLWGSQKEVQKASETNNILNRDLCASKDRVEELLRLLAEKEDQLMDFEGKSSSLTEHIRSISNELASEKEKTNSLQSALATSDEHRLSLNASIENLTARISTLTAEAEKCSNVLETTRSDAAAFRAFAHGLEKGLFEQLDDEMMLVQSWWESRLNYLVKSLSGILTKSELEKTALRVSKEQIETTCRELSSFVKEAKISIHKNDQVVSERQEAFTSRFALLEGQNALLRREKDQASAQLVALLGRYEEEKKASESSKAQLQISLQEARARYEKSEKEATRLRIGVEAEVKRKCEYKQALENLKKLRSDSEGLRIIEKEKALAAINRANNEANYWVLCFDRLKRMVENSRQTGRRLPSIDADTLSRLEEAKTKISPFEAHEVNTMISAVSRLKRAREEGTELSR